MAVPLALSLRFPELIPRIFTDSNKGPILQMGFAAGLSVGIFEELGWTGRQRDDKLWLLPLGFNYAVDHCCSERHSQPTTPSPAFSTRLASYTAKLTYHPNDTNNSRADRSG